MATGDQSDLLKRIKSLLPFRWFPDSTPVLDALLNGPAWALSQIYALIQYAKLQTRIATATDGFLDLISYDFFGNNLRRRLQETDNAFRTRILATLFRPKATRQGMIDALVNLTGRTPIIFEPARPADTGGYGIASGYGVAGGWGSLRYPAQAFITAFRPAGSGIPNVAGYDTSYGSYGGGYSMWASLAQVTGAVTDADIYDTINRTAAAGTRMWVRLQS
jgi:hypothetical protein